MNDGIIELNTERANKLGFTFDKFRGYLWKDKKYIIISFITSLHEGQGNLSKLFKNIEEKGYGIKVPTPFPKMQQICMNHGFKPTKEYFKREQCWVEVWVKEVTV